MKRLDAAVRKFLRNPQDVPPVLERYFAEVDGRDWIAEMIDVVGWQVVIDPDEDEDRWNKTDEKANGESDEEADDEKDTPRVCSVDDLSPGKS